MSRQSTPKLMRQFHGLDGTIMAYGVVENRNDPLKLGRVKCRFLGWHTESKIDMPTDMLPWSTPLLPVDDGRSVVGLREGDWVVAIFKDGITAQEPLILGKVLGISEIEADPSKGFNDPRIPELGGHRVPRDPVSWPIQFDDGSGSIWMEIAAKSNYPQNEDILTYVDNKEPDSNRFSRNEYIADTIVQVKKDNIAIGQTDVPTNGHPSSGVGTDKQSSGRLWTEWETQYNSTYPYNHAYFSEAGHIWEIDDTPGAERLHWYHRTGTFFEMAPDGTLVNKIVSNEYHITLRNRYTHIEAGDYETVDWGKQEFVNKDMLPDCNYDITIGENGDMNLTIKKGQWNINVTNGDANIYINGNVNMRVTKDINLEVGGNFNTTVMGDVNTIIQGTRNTFISGSDTTTVCTNKNTNILGTKQEDVAGDVATTHMSQDTITVGGTLTQHIAVDLITKVQGLTRYISVGDYHLGCSDTIFVKALKKITISAILGRVSFVELRLGIGNLFVSSINMVVKVLAVLGLHSTYFNNVASEAIYEEAGTIYNNPLPVDGGGAAPEPPPIPEPPPPPADIPSITQQITDSELF